MFRIYFDGRPPGGLTANAAAADQASSNASADSALSRDHLTWIGEGDHLVVEVDTDTLSDSTETAIVNAVSDHYGRGHLRTEDV